jgi:hypothetical protein
VCPCLLMHCLGSASTLVVVLSRGMVIKDIVWEGGVSILY